MSKNIVTNKWNTLKPSRGPRRHPFDSVQKTVFSKKHFGSEPSPEVSGEFGDLVWQAETMQDVVEGTQEKTWENLAERLPIIIRDSRLDEVGATRIARLIIQDVKPDIDYIKIPDVFASGRVPVVNDSSSHSAEEESAAA